MPQKHVSLQKHYCLLLIAVSIVTGTPYNKLINLGNINSREEIPEKYDLVYSSHYRVWVRPYRMPKRHPLSKAFLAETIDSVPRIILGDYFEIGKRLQALENGQWFKHTADTFQKTYNKIIRPRLESAGIEPTWLRLSRIDNLIPQWMLGMEEGDQLIFRILNNGDFLSKADGQALQRAADVGDGGASEHGAPLVR